LAASDGVFRQLLAATAPTGDGPTDGDEEARARLGAELVDRPYRDWLAADALRQPLRIRWRQFFTEYDAILLPVAPNLTIQHDYDVVVVDDYSNSSPAELDRVQKIAGRPLHTYRVDLRDRRALGAVFDRHPIDAVVHFAAKKAVGESIRLPIDYYDTNVGGTTNLLRAMLERGVHRMVFSSSCSVYGEAERSPLAEHHAARPTNPYGRSKWICEQVIGDAC